MRITFEQGLMLGIAILTWSYSITCLIKAKNIEVKCDGGSNVSILVLYVLASGSLIALDYKNILNIIIGVVLTVGGVVYSLIPSGYDKEYVYLRGFRVKYADIKEMNLSDRGNQSQLSISMDKNRYRTLFATYEDKNKLIECMTRWRKGK